MRIIQIICTVVCLGSAASAFAARPKLCSKYAASCKADKAIKQMPKDSKLAAIHDCIVQAATADGANGAACLKEQAGRKH